jgi:aminoglycoside 6'-N-acetyltransferase
VKNKKQQTYALKWRVRIIMLFQNGNLKVRKLEEKDNYLLAKWLSDPLVLEFYEGRDNPFDLDKVNKVFYSSKDDEVRCIVEFDGTEIGYIQFYQLDDATKKEYGYFNENIYGTDQFIGEVKYWNKGIGTLLVTSMVKFLIEHKKAVRVVMDPQTRNTRAIKCYEKCGFRKVRILPNRELHEGKYQDCWLIEYHKWNTPPSI